MEKICEIHKERYGDEADVVAVSPGRIHLIGEHSWFFKDKTLSVAVDVNVYVAISKRTDSSFKFYFAQYDKEKKANLASLKFKKEDKWANAIKAIIYGFTSGGFNVDGANFTVYSEVLPSQGFGITNAIKVASTLALNQLFNFKCNSYKLLQVLERANKLFLKRENYISDNFSALFAKSSSFLVTDYTKNAFENFEIPFKDKSCFLVDLNIPQTFVWNETTLFEPENALILGDMREAKNNVFGSWQYINDVTDINEELSQVSEDTRRKLLCILREHSDILEVIKALQKDDFSLFCRTVNHSFESLRDFYDFSCPETNWVLKRVYEIVPNLQNKRDVVSCGSITGKSSGRYIYVILRNEDVDKFKDKLVEYERIFGFHPKYLEVHPSSGAKVLK